LRVGIVPEDVFLEVLKFKVPQRYTSEGFNNFILITFLRTYRISPLDQEWQKKKKKKKKKKKEKKRMRRSDI